MTVNRFIVIVLDSVGIGGLPDAALLGDVGRNTLGNMARAVGGPKVPIGFQIRAGVNIGVRPTFADMAATVADALGVALPPQGTSFKPLILG
jgi:phosphopentomutase